MDIVKELEQNQAVLVIIPGTEYNDFVLDVMKGLSGKYICYITLNKTCDALQAIFSKNNIDVSKLRFIDGVSRVIKEKPQQGNCCLFVSSPDALTELSIAINKFLVDSSDYLVFDSITNIAIYKKQAPVAKFISMLVNKVRSTKVKAIFYAIDVKEQKELIEECSMFVDKVIELNKKK